MVFSKLMESVLQNLKGKEYEIFMQHGISIPNCYNFAMEAVVKSQGITHVWFVEEDHVFPNDTLDRMLAVNVDVVATAYGDRRSEVNLVQYQNNGDVIYSGMGCMLVKREVFDKLESPYFRTVFIELKKDEKGFVTLIPRSNIHSEGYGGQDIYFCTTLVNSGFKINLLPNSKVGHMMLMETGKDGTNQGKHIIKTVYLPVDKNGNEIQGDNYDLCKSI